MLGLKSVALLEHINHLLIIFQLYIFNRPGVAGAVLQSPMLLIDSVIQPFPPNRQNIINHKQ